MKRLITTLALMVAAVVASTGGLQAREVRVSIVLLPHVMLYGKCLNDAWAAGNRDPVAACTSLRESLVAQARSTLDQSGYADRMLQEMRRFERELNIQDKLIRSERSNASN